MPSASKFDVLDKDLGAPVSPAQPSGCLVSGAKQASGASQAGGAVAVCSQEQAKFGAGPPLYPGPSFSSAFDDPDDWTFGEEDLSPNMTVPGAVPAEGSSFCVGGFGGLDGEVFSSCPQVAEAAEVNPRLGEPSADHWDMVFMDLMQADSLHAVAEVPSTWAHLGTEASRAKVRAAAAVASCAPCVTVEPMPVPLARTAFSPAQALERRNGIKEEVRRSRAATRAAGRRLRVEQVKSCRRPKRVVDGPVVLATVNANSFKAIREELEHGHVLTQAHYLAVQEH